MTHCNDVAVRAGRGLTLSLPPIVDLDHQNIAAQRPRPCCRDPLKVTQSALGAAARCVKGPKAQGHKASPPDVCAFKTQAH